MAFLALVALLPLALLIALLWRAEPGDFPAAIEIGGMLVRFTTVDRLSYQLAMIAIVVGVLAGLIGIWLPGAGIFTRILSSAGLVFLGSVLTLVAEPAHAHGPQANGLESRARLPQTLTQNLFRFFIAHLLVHLALAGRPGREWKREHQGARYVGLVHDHGPRRQDGRAKSETPGHEAVFGAIGLGRVEAPDNPDGGVGDQPALDLAGRSAGRRSESPRGFAPARQYRAARH